MSDPQRNSLTDTTKLVVDWVAITAPETGNSPVISYSLEFDQGSSQNSWITLTGYLNDFTELTYTVTDSVERGGSFYFRLRAKNDWGWGVYSNAVKIIAATKPLQVDNITSHVLSSSGDF